MVRPNSPSSRKVDQPFGFVPNVGGWASPHARLGVGPHTDGPVLVHRMSPTQEVRGENLPSAGRNFDVCSLQNKRKNMTKQHHDSSKWIIKVDHLPSLGLFLRRVDQSVADSTVHS